MSGSLGGSVPSGVSGGCWEASGSPSAAAGSSNAGRAWCHGASGLRGVEGAGLRAGSSVGEASRWLAEPCDALRARRGRTFPATSCCSAAVSAGGPAVAPAVGPPIEPSVGLPIEPSDGLPIEPSDGLPVEPSVGLPVGLSVAPPVGAAARWDAEPWLALRDRRGAGAAVGSPAGEAWLTEPSAAVRERRGAAGVSAPGVC